MEHLPTPHFIRLDLITKIIFGDYESPHSVFSNLLSLLHCLAQHLGNTSQEQNKE
jgi:hypothetical protein